MFNQYRIDFHDEVKEQPGTKVFDDRKREVIDWIKKTIPPFEERFKNVVDRAFPSKSK